MLTIKKGGGARQNKTRPTRNIMFSITIAVLGPCGVPQLVTVITGLEVWCRGEVMCGRLHTRAVQGTTHVITNAGP